MAEEEEKDAEGEAEELEKKPLPKIIGGIVGILGMSYLAFTMAVPKKEVTKLLEGPFVQMIFEQALSINLDVSSRKRYLLVNFNCIYWTYEEAYVAERMLDPLTLPLIQDAVLRISSSKTIEDVFGKVSSPIYLEEIREVIQPIVFPVVIGDSGSSTYDPESGLRVASFSQPGTFRGEHDRGELHVDGVEKTLQLGSGEPTEFVGNELALGVTSELGETVYVDVTRCDNEFVGVVKVGVKGRVQQVIFEDRIVQ